MTWPSPIGTDHARFCQREGWERVRDARGRSGTRYITFRLLLPDGRTLRTRISHPPDRTVYGRNMWAHILRQQLEVTEEEFWVCVREGRLPDRGLPAAPVRSLPADLAYHLIHHVKLTEAEVAAMTRDEAIERLNKHWAGEG